MAPIQTAGHCPTCGQQRMFTKPGMSHLLHLILSVLTLGIWLIVWLILAMGHSTKKPRCTNCGTELRQQAPLP